MKRTYGLGLLIVATTLVFTWAPAEAATVAAGPYYATPSWDQTLPSSTRFIVLSNMSSNAVLDRETGLVWEQSPSTTGDSWFNQSSHCINLNTGGRTGWRLPTIQELLSLVDRTHTNPSLPSGHPFTVQSFVYWSATTRADDAAVAWDVFFGDGGVGFGDKSSSVAILAWCVRGAPGVDPQ